MTITAAHVVVVGTSIGADTRDDGRYTIVVPPGTYTVRASRIGFAPDSVTGVSVAAGGSAAVNFQLKPTANQLASVVVVGYGEEKARDITGSVATVTTKDFNPGRIVSPQQLIQAKVPGVTVIGSNEPGGSNAIRIRGGSSVTSSNEPLFVVDGMPLAIGGGISAGRDPLNFLNPNDIETITVLKDASATAIYGSRGANGVVIGAGQVLTSVLVFTFHPLYPIYRGAYGVSALTDQKLAGIVMMVEQLVVLGTFAYLLLRPRIRHASLAHA